MRRHPSRKAGFTLLEMLVVVALIGLVMGVSAPYLGAAMGVQVRRASRQLTGTIRYVFDAAVLQSTNYRIIFNLDLHSYSVEVCEDKGTAILWRNADERVEGEERLEERRRKLEDYASSHSQMPQLADMGTRSCSKSEDPTLADVILEEPLTLLGVWTPQYPGVIRGNPDGPPEDPADQQIVTLNFLKGGYVERAFIYLSDGGDEIQTLEVQPLTGEVVLHDGAVDIPNEY